MFTKKYKISEVEAKWQHSWEKKPLYLWNPDESRENNFSIDTPPPTVSGQLHIGHIFSYTHTDFIARFQRMRGKNVFYPIGFDDNGLPTERLVEKIKKTRAKDLPRHEFVNMCRQVVCDIEKEYRKLFKKAAISFDWQQEYQTISPRSIKMSQMSFLDLYDKKLVEWCYAPCFWDSVDQTAIAQAEIEDKEKDGQMNDILFSLESGKKITIATTRPELLPACRAIFYHPDDTRYKNLQNQQAIIPLFGFKVKILTDNDVDMKKGTGLVMCCTFGDIQDIAWWRNYNLGIVQCIDKYGKMQNAGKYDGLKVNAARELIIKDLLQQQLLIKQISVKQFIKSAERSGAALEIIPMQQWYISILNYKQQLLDQSAKCNWYPKYMKTRLDNWINGLNQDWCISRQRYFGVPFPLWYSKKKGEEGKIIVADIDQLPVDPLIDLPKGYNKDDVEYITDVMDTWATSAISPQLNSLGLSENFVIDNNKHHKLFPFDLRPQAHEIIRTWSFYTIVKSYHHQNTIPWKNITLSGWCLAHDRSKMSKSKGNVITPDKIFIEYGTDVMRYWAANSRLGADTAYCEEILKIGKKLVNKIFNASKFVGDQLAGNSIISDNPVHEINKNNITYTVDLWILSRLYLTIKNVNQEFEKFEFANSRGIIEDFFWNDFCDNYLELVKYRIYSTMEQNKAGKTSALYTVYHVLKSILLLFAPFLPHITEEMNLLIFDDESVHKRGGWPELKKHFYNDKILQQGTDIVALLELVRKYKSQHNMALNAPLGKIYYHGCELDITGFNDLKNTTTAKDMIAKDIKENEYVSHCCKYKINIL